MILLEDDLLRPLPIGQVNLKSYLPQTGLFFAALVLYAVYSLYSNEGWVGGIQYSNKGGGGGGGDKHLQNFILFHKK